MKVLKKVSLSAMLLLALCITSCDKLVYDDLSLCPQGVNIMLYSKSPCAATPSYPKEVKDTRIFAFDDQGVLRGRFESSGVVLSESYRQTVDYLYVGRSTFYAWGSEDLSRYDFSAFEVGKTTKDQMILSLKLQAEGQSEADMPHLFAGEPTTLTQEDRTKIGTHYDDLKINLQQITNTISLTVKGLYSNRRYEARIVSPNDKYHMDGTIAGSTPVDFTTKSNKFEGGILTANFRVLRMLDNPSINLVIRDLDSDQDVFEGNLVKIITKDGHYDLACDHTFEVSLEVDPGPVDSFILVRGKIKGWNVVYQGLIVGE